MSHCNITMRDRDSTVNRLRLDYAKLEIEKKFIERQLEDVESNLRSIFERIASGQEVYLQYDDGMTIHIMAVPEKATS